MKTLTAYLVCALGFLPNVMGQGSTQVNYAAALDQPNVYTLSGTPGPVTDGNSVWLGAFNNGFDVLANESDPAALLANWTLYDSTPITTLVIGPFTQPGSFNGSETSTNPFFDNKKMWLWIFSTDDGGAPAGDFSNVNSYGLFTSNHPDWVFPQVSVGGIKDIWSSQVDQARHGSFDSTHLYLSTFNPVPEPSTLGLLSLAVPAVVLALRKRRSNG